MQALYNHPSVGTPLKFVLVRMDIMKRQPLEMPHYDGERSDLLNSFCSYQQSLNPASDANPGHWDMALYVSGYVSTASIVNVPNRKLRGR